MWNCFNEHCVLLNWIELNFRLDCIFLYTPQFIYRCDFSISAYVCNNTNYLYCTRQLSIRNICSGHHFYRCWCWWNNNYNVWNRSRIVWFRRWGHGYRLVTIHVLSTCQEEAMASIKRRQCQVSRGSNGKYQEEAMASIRRKQWQVSRGSNGKYQDVLKFLSEKPHGWVCHLIGL